MKNNYLNINNNCNKNCYTPPVNDKKNNNSNNNNNCCNNTINSLFEVGCFLNNLTPIIKSLKIYKILKH